VRNCIRRQGEFLDGKEAKTHRTGERLQPSCSSRPRGAKPTRLSSVVIAVLFQSEYSTNKSKNLTSEVNQEMKDK